MEQLVQFPIRFKWLILIILTFLILGCQDNQVVEITNPNITMSQGAIYYQGKAYNGKIKEENPTMEEVYITSYKNGVEDGEYLAQKKSGQILEKRFYQNGAKHGIHRSWFPNGSNRLYSEFDNGKYINDRWEWHDNNMPYIYEKFDRNGKILITKMWRRNGKIYMNLAFTNTGASVGMPGSKNCDPIKPKEKELEE